MEPITIQHDKNFMCTNTHKRASGAYSKMTWLSLGSLRVLEHPKNQTEAVISYTNYFGFSIVKNQLFYDLQPN